MLFNEKIFKTVDIKIIKPNTMSVSRDGKVLDLKGIHNPSYISSNGYMYEFIKTFDDNVTLFPFDMIMALTFIDVPEEFNGKHIMVKHKDGNTMNCRCENLEWIEDVEEWRDITYKDIKRGYYQISNYGKVRSMLYNPPRIMKTELNKQGYHRISLITNNGNGKHFSIHRLVAYTFVRGYDNPDLMVNHINGCKTDNMWYNLEWVTNGENQKHANIIGLHEIPNKIISADDARLICLCLNKHNGCLMETYNDLINIIPNLTYPIISSIKYENTFTTISSIYLNDHGRKKQIRQTDPDVILDVSYCLKKHNGDVKKTKHELESKYPWISYGWIWHIKDKSVGSAITDKVFNKDEFPKCTILSENDVMMVINCLIKHKGDDHINQIVFDELKEQVPGLTKDKVRAIKEKKSWRELSDKFFDKNAI